MQLRILICLCCAAVAVEASANDLYVDVNRVRAGDGHCPVAGTPPALQRRAALEQAAQELARGGALQDSLNRASYRATRS